VIRIIFGMGERPIGSTFNKLVRNWFPRRQQAGAVSFANAGTPLGAALSGPVAGFLAIALGWRTAFVAITLIGLVWVVFWMLLATDRPEENKRVSTAERAKLVAGQVNQPSGGPPVPLSSLILRLAVPATAFAFFGYSCIMFFFINWFPTYLTTARHLSVKHMAYAIMIP
jgi:ACS family hexuronate transporter-like MFS transporter